jgi:hypothetical protein
MLPDAGMGRKQTLSVQADCERRTKMTRLTITASTYYPDEVGIG